MAPVHTKMHLRSVRVLKKDIAYVRWMLESHDGLATPTTRPGTDDVLDLLIAPDFVDEFDSLLRAIGEEILLEEVPIPLTTSLQES